MARAAETAVALAREAGVAWVAVRRSNHAGPAGIYAEAIAAEGMIGIYSVVASANHMAPWGGSEMLLGTNPLAVAIPCGGQPPLVLDIATTAVSYGTVKNYALQGREMPEGWMVDRADGTPLTDSAARRRGNAPAHRRAQGQRARYRARASCRATERGGVRSRRGGFQRRFLDGDEYRPLHHRAWTSRASPSRRLFTTRSIGIFRICATPRRCRQANRSACRGTRGQRGAQNVNGRRADIRAAPRKTERSSRNAIDRAASVALPEHPRPSW